MHDVLHPREVGVARRRRAVLPTFVIAQSLAAPIGNVEGRIGENEVGLQVRVAVVVEGVALRDLAAVDAADGEVPCRFQLRAGWYRSHCWRASLK
jgi:hypothetical protein